MLGGGEGMFWGSKHERGWGLLCRTEGATPELPSFFKNTCFLKDHVRKGESRLQAAAIPAGGALSLAGHRGRLRCSPVQQSLDKSPFFGGGGVLFLAGPVAPPLRSQRLRKGPSSGGSCKVSQPQRPALGIPPASLRFAPSRSGVSPELPPTSKPRRAISPGTACPSLDIHPKQASFPNRRGGGKNKERRVARSPRATRAAGQRRQGGGGKGRAPAVPRPPKLLAGSPALPATSSRRRALCTGEEAPTCCMQRLPRRAPPQRNFHRRPGRLTCMCPWYILHRLLQAPPEAGRSWAGWGTGGDRRAAAPPPPPQLQGRKAQGTPESCVQKRRRAGSGEAGPPAASLARGREGGWVTSSSSSPPPPPPQASRGLAGLSSYAEGGALVPEGAVLAGAEERERAGREATSRSALLSLARSLCQEAALQGKHPAEALLLLLLRAQLRPPRLPSQLCRSLFQANSFGLPPWLLHGSSSPRRPLPSCWTEPLPPSLPPSAQRGARAIRGSFGSPARARPLPACLPACCRVAKRGVRMEGAPDPGAALLSSRCPPPPQDQAAKSLRLGKTGSGRRRFCRAEHDRDAVSRPSFHG